MVKQRLALVADERFAALRPALAERLSRIAAAITPETFESICPPLVQRLVVDTVQRIGASEGSLWLADRQRQALVACSNTGPNAARIVGFEQPLNRGLLSIVYTHQTALVENEVFRDPDHDKRLNERLGQVTHSMVAVPLGFLGECRGVISSVQLTQAGVTSSSVPAFNDRDLQVLQVTAAVIRELIDSHLLQITVGWKPS